MAEIKRNTLLGILALMSLFVINCRFDSQAGGATETILNTHTPQSATASPVSAPGATQTVVAPSATPTSTDSSSWDWPTATPEEEGMDSALLADLLGKIESDGNHIHSLLIVRHGHLVLEDYFDPFDKNTAHQLASVTKSFTGALIGKAIEKGYLKGVDQPLYTFFSDVTLDDPAKKAITIGNVLSMSSGLDWPEWDNEYRSPVNPYSTIIYENDSAKYFFDQPMAHTPGKVFNYNTGGSHLLSAVVTRASGESTLDFAKKELFGPLGISDVKWETAEDGIYKGGAGLSLRPRDMAKFGQLYLQQGIWQGQPIINKDWINQSAQAHATYSPTVKYGYQWWLPQSKGMVAVGWGNQNIWVLPQADMVVVFTAGVKNEQLLPHATYLDHYILASVKSDKALPANPSGYAKLQKTIALNGHPQAKPVHPVPATAQSLVGKTYLVTDASITLGLQSMTIKRIGANDMEMTIGLTGEDDDLKVGLDGIYRRSPTKTGEIALKGDWVDDHTLDLTWQELGSPENAKLRVSYQGEKIEVKVDLWVEGISETSHGEPLYKQ